MNIATFLKKVAKLAEEGNIEIIENKKNMQTKRKYNLTTEDQENMIKQLKPSDWIKGPVPDRDIVTEDVWMFKKKYDDIEVLIYIKLKIRNNKECICLSIHEDEEK
ncbi:MAG: type II toxin-antitoxin system MqsR family toxin [Clostridiales bacterium]|nr:type II toxin-antitoxin system MqsR family toxin [Clostridiales bacterium]